MPEFLLPITVLSMFSLSGGFAEEEPVATGEVAGGCMSDDDDDEDLTRAIVESLADPPRRFDESAGASSSFVAGGFSPSFVR